MKLSHLHCVVGTIILVSISIILYSISIYEYNKVKTSDLVENQCLVKNTKLFRASCRGRSTRASCYDAAWFITYVNKLEDNQDKDLLVQIQTEAEKSYITEIGAIDHLKQYQVILFVMQIFKKY
jgi:hypothetical protein